MLWLFLEFSMNEPKNSENGQEKPPEEQGQDQDQNLVILPDSEFMGMLPFVEFGPDTV